MQEIFTFSTGFGSRDIFYTSELKWEIVTFQDYIVPMQAVCAAASLILSVCWISYSISPILHRFHSDLTTCLALAEAQIRTLEPTNSGYLTCKDISLVSERVMQYCGDAKTWTVAVWGFTVECKSECQCEWLFISSTVMDCWTVQDAGLA